LPKLNACQNCRAFFDASLKECPHCGVSIVPRQVRERGGLVDRLVRKEGAVTLAIIGANVLVYLAMLAVAQRFQTGGGLRRFGDPGTQIWRFGAMTWDGVVDRGEWYRLLCAVFLHFSIWHILFNCYVLFQIGRIIEHFYGPAKFLATYVLMGLIASVTSLLWHGEGPWIGAGASGAIMGVLGLLIAFTHRRGLNDVKYSLIKWVVVILVFGMLIGADNAAHIGGLVAGLALGWTLKTSERTRLSVRAVLAWDTAAFLSVAAVVVSFGFALVRSGVIPIG
jgi:rhomboid protease GluP